jgi:FkbM family methyltransferase
VGSRWRHYAGRVVDEFILPFAPKESRLTIHYYKCVSLLKWENEIRYIRDYGRASELAIDVGANIGLYSYALAKTGMFSKVLSFEPNATLTCDLENAALESVTIIHKALSNVEGKSILNIPVDRGLPLTGWGSLESDIDLEASHRQEIMVSTATLDSLDLEGCGFIKVDVEGHELAFLEGARKFFLKNKPVCLIECRTRNLALLRQYFTELMVGYQAVDTMSKYGFQLAAGNFLFSVT